MNLYELNSITYFISSSLSFTVSDEISSNTVQIDCHIFKKYTFGAGWPVWEEGLWGTSRWTLNEVPECAFPDLTLYFCASLRLRPGKSRMMELWVNLYDHRQQESCFNWKISRYWRWARFINFHRHSVGGTVLILIFMTHQEGTPVWVMGKD